MKTYEETAAALISRKAEYDKKKESNKRRLSLIAVIAAAVILMTTIPVGLIMVASRADQPVDIPDTAMIGTTRTDGETEETPTSSEPIKTEPNATAETDPEQVLKEAAIVDQIVGKGNKPQKESSQFTVSFQRVVKEGEEYINIPMIDVMNLSEKAKEYAKERLRQYDITCTEHKDFIEYDITVYKLISGFTGKFKDSADKNEFLLRLSPSESIDLISDEIIELNFENETSVTTKVKFRYKDGCSNGTLNAAVFDKDSGEAYNTGRERPAFVSVKGYDFDCKRINPALLYRFISIYFGDVDENGEPLFYKDPYIADYYSNPWCQYLRGEIEFDRHTIDDYFAPDYWDLAHSQYYQEDRAPGP